MEKLLDSEKYIVIVTESFIAHAYTNLDKKTYIDNIYVYKNTYAYIYTYTHSNIYQNLYLSRKRERVSVFRIGKYQQKHGFC